MSTCVKASSNFILFDNVVLHVLILFCIVSALFVFYITKLTIKSFNDEFIHIVDKTINPEKIKEILQSRLGPDPAKNIKEKLIQELKISAGDRVNLSNIDKLTKFIIELKNPDLESLNQLFTKISDNFYKNKDKLRTTINNNIIKNIIMIVVFFIVLAVVINYFSSYFNQCGFLPTLGVELLVTFALVCVIEFWFFTNVAQKYVPVSPDKLTVSFVDYMSQKLNS
jgi:hypothetical protein